MAELRADGCVPAMPACEQRPGTARVVVVLNSEAVDRFAVEPVAGEPLARGSPFKRANAAGGRAGQPVRPIAAGFHTAGDRRHTAAAGHHADDGADCVGSEEGTLWAAH